jgi:DNA mismatch repair ATPase MutL
LARAGRVGRRSGAPSDIGTGIETRGDPDSERALSDERVLTYSDSPHEKEKDSPHETRVGLEDASSLGDLEASKGKGDDFFVKLEPEATDAPRVFAAAAFASSTPPISFSMADLRRRRAASRRVARDRARRNKRKRDDALPRSDDADGGGLDDAKERETNVTEREKSRSAFAAASLGAADGAAVSVPGDAEDDDAPPPPPPPPPAAAAADPLGPALSEGDATATHALERVFRKADFAKMRVVGQFNLGFILAVLGSDLFIVDQHASDEIFNFERLQRTTTLNRQPLIAPARLDLTAAEEQTVRRHMDVFLANGFGFCEDAERGAVGAPLGDADADADAECGVGCCLALRSVPFSKGTTFGVADVQELIGMLDDGAYAAPARTQLSVGLSSGKAAEPRRNENENETKTKTNSPRRTCSARRASARCWRCARVARAS